MQKRCLTIQDYSCMGRCSLTVALPLLSVCGVECVGLPTAVLSNHTAFPSWTYMDLSDEMIPSLKKWRNTNNHFDCIYTGYLGEGQADIVIKFIEELQHDGLLVVVDPAYGDNGKLYAGFDFGHVSEMKRLIGYANIICPNLTEATTLLGCEYNGEIIAIKEAESICKKLAKLGPQKVVLTGVLNDKGQVGNVMYDAETKKTGSYYTECLPGRYHGAGDTFASVMVGAMMNGVSFFDAIKIAHDFVHRAMALNIEDQLDGVKYGLEFERVIPSLIKDLHLDK